MKVPALIREALRVTPGRPHLAAGIRAAVAAAAPMVLGLALGRHDLVWASIGGFNTVLADKGGAYRTRAASMASLAVASPLAVLLGTWVAPHLAVALPLLLGVVTVCGFAGVLGAEATSVGVSTAVSFVISLSLPSPSAAAAWPRAGLMLAGCAVALCYSLLLWPLRPFRPARLAIAGSLRAVGRLAQALPEAREGESWLARRNDLAMRAREAIEKARAMFGLFRRGRAGASRRGEQLIVLLEGADQLFGHLVALEDSLATGRVRQGSRLQEAAARSSLRVAAELGRLAEAMEAERALDAARAPDEDAPASRAPAASTDPVEQEVAAVLAAALAQLHELGETARALDDPQAAAPSCREIDVEPAARPAPWLARARENLTLDSALLRHALRISLSTTAVFLVARALHLPRGYWATLTCLVILQPHGAATFAKALQRVGGTIVGAGVAIAVTYLIHDPRLIMAFIFASAAVSVALLPLNYGIFAVFLTPSFVLMAEASTGDPSLAKVRVLDTLLGAAVALSAARLLFPFSEREKFPALMGEAMGALRDLFEVARLGAPPPSRVDAARARVGLALLNAEASLQRLLTESARAAEEAEPLATILLYAHRLTSSVISVAISRSGAALGERAATIAAALTDLREALETGRAPRPLPAAKGTPTPIPGAEAAPRDRGDLIFAQLAVQHGAIQRWQAARRVASPLPAVASGRAPEV